MDATLQTGSGGIFDVVVDGVLVFSRKAEGRFPHPDEVAFLMQQRGLVPHP